MGIYLVQLYIWPCMYTVNEVNILRTAHHVAFDAANSSLLSAISQPLCQNAVEDLERCMPWHCRSNVIIYIGQPYIWPRMYTVNEVNIWWTAQHAAFDAVNSILLSTTSKHLCQKAVEDLDCCMPWSSLCSGSNVSIYLGQPYMWPCE